MFVTVVYLKLLYGTFILFIRIFNVYKIVMVSRITNSFNSLLLELKN